MELPDKFKSRDLELVIREHELLGWTVVRWKKRQVVFRKDKDPPTVRYYQKRGKCYVGGCILKPLPQPKGSIFYLDHKYGVQFAFNHKDEK